MDYLYNEVIKRFPEMLSYLNDEDKELPYLVMGYLADWIKKFKASEITPELTKRIVNFAQWCEKQPRGETSKDDLYTILVVAFYEALFTSESTRFLIPKLMSKQEILNNEEYLKIWVGKDNYNLTIEEYKK